MMEIIEIEGGEWLDEHRTRDRRAVRTFKLKGSATRNLAADLAQRTQKLGALLDRLAVQGHPVTITGSAWSQSDLFASPAVRIDTAQDTAIWDIPSAALGSQFTGNAQHFIMASGGARLKDIMQFLDERGLSFRTAGSHNGQSIAGAIATGTHGSLLGEMGLETHIRGLLFVAGSGASHWIADPDCPVLGEDFVARFATQADPGLFTDTVIHLGGLGYLAAVLIEAVPRFGLSWKKALAPLAHGWWDAVAKADYASAAAPVIGGRQPAFYELTFDPNRRLDEAVMQTIYWHDELPTEYPRAPGPAPRHECVRDTLDVVADAINGFSAYMVASHADMDDEGDDSEDGIFSFARRLRLLDIAGMTFDDFAEEIAQKPTSQRPESLLALTGNWQPRDVLGIRIDTFNAALGVPVADLRRTLEIGISIASKWRKHFVLTVRFATKSRASMSFLRFDDTAIINIDGLTRAGIAGWISHSDEFSRDFTNALEDAGIAFSMHWGKDIPSRAEKITADFGDAAIRYKAARAALVPAPVRDILCPPQLKAWGLA